eukprot:m.74637 g.74637  ORF g.74637 m.74637 type:complete len:112 (-) comp24682_c0_seq2:54-389(-)
MVRRNLDLRFQFACRDGFLSVFNHTSEKIVSKRCSQFVCACILTAKRLQVYVDRIAVHPKTTDVVNQQALITMVIARPSSVAMGNNCKLWLPQTQHQILCALKRTRSKSVG